MLCMASCHITAHVLELVFIAAMQVLLTYLSARTVALANESLLVSLASAELPPARIGIAICTIEAVQGLCDKHRHLTACRTAACVILNRWCMGVKKHSGKHRGIGLMT